MPHGGWAMNRRGARAAAPWSVGGCWMGATASVYGAWLGFRLLLRPFELSGRPDKRANMEVH